MLRSSCYHSIVIAKQSPVSRAGSQMSIMQRGGCVYIMTNEQHSVLYVGVTSDIVSRVWEHKSKIHPNSFTAKYNCKKLVYYYFYHHIEEVIAAEKLIKGGNRQSKIALINGINPEWLDLYSQLEDV